MDRSFVLFSTGFPGYRVSGLKGEKHDDEKQIEGTYSQKKGLWTSHLLHSPIFNDGSKPVMPGFTYMELNENQEAFLR